MEHWPLTRPTLEVLQILVKEQLDLGHVHPSMSLWNTPVYVIKKAFGTRRMLQNLGRVNERMELVGTHLRVLAWVPAIPAEYALVVIDVKDCFFSIPLHPEDCSKFVFSIPSLNLSQPDQKFEWIVLPQGMANSPAFCPQYLATLLGPLLRTDGSLHYIYMDDIVLGK